MDNRLIGFLAICGMVPAGKPSETQRVKDNVIDSVKNAGNSVVNTLSDAGNAVVDAVKPKEKTTVDKIADEIKSATK